LHRNLGAQSQLYPGVKLKKKWFSLSRDPIVKCQKFRDPIGNNRFSWKRRRFTIHRLLHPSDSTGNPPSIMVTSLPHIVPPTDAIPRLLSPGGGGGEQGERTQQGRERKENKPRKTNKKEEDQGSKRQRRAKYERGRKTKTQRQGKPENNTGGTTQGWEEHRRDGGEKTHGQKNTTKKTLQRERDRHRNEEKQRQKERTRKDEEENKTQRIERSVSLYTIIGFFSSRSGKSLCSLSPSCNINSLVTVHGQF